MPTGSLHCHDQPVNVLTDHQPCRLRCGSRHGHLVDHRRHDISHGEGAFLDVALPNVFLREVRAKLPKLGVISTINGARDR